MRGRHSLPPLLGPAAHQRARDEDTGEGAWGLHVWEGRDGHNACAYDDGLWGDGHGHGRAGEGPGPGPLGAVLSLGAVAPAGWNAVASEGVPT